MMEQIKFIRSAADKLRELAASAPDLAEQLRLLADELETEALRLAQGTRRPHN